MKKKLLSIVLAVTLVLSFGLMAAPVMAADVGLDVLVTQPTLTVNIIGGGRVPWMSILGQAQDSGIFEATTNTLDFDAGSGFALTFVPDSGWRFGGATGDGAWLRSTWGGDVYDGRYITEPWWDMSSDKTLTVTFIKEYSLTTSSSEGGSVTTPGEDTYIYDEGDVVNLVATADAGYLFDSWGGDLSGDENPTEVTIDADKVVTANFIEKIVAIEVDRTVIDFGSVMQGQTGDGGTLTIDNIGNVPAMVSTSPITTGVFQYMMLEGDAGNVLANAYTVTLAVYGSDSLEVTLPVPTGWSHGSEIGTLTFIASPVPAP